MIQELIRTRLYQTKVKELTDFKIIEGILFKLLHVPVNRIKPMVIKKLIEYLKSKIINNNYKIKIYTAYKGSEACGFVICQINPYYRSYSRKCGIFGWLNVDNFDTCKKLIYECESFFRKNKIRKVRANLNFPKSLGGIGFQTSGFTEQPLYGVAFNQKNHNIIAYLKRLGYQVESEYTCMKVSSKTWEKGKKLDKTIRFEYLPLKELNEKKEEILELIKNSFRELLPDSSGNRFDEFIDAYSQVPKSYYRLNRQLDYNNYSNISAFTEAWDACNLEKIVPWAPIAIDRSNGDIVGMILGLPDLFQLWSEGKISRANVDTVMVKKGYKGKGIFSALNNIGQLTCNLYGVDYFEGTTIWTNNSRGVNNQEAINSIMPHCYTLRTHVILQNRIKSV